jgi:hypothetical protein
MQKYQINLNNYIYECLYILFNIHRKWQMADVFYTEGELQDK